VAGGHDVQLRIQYRQHSQQFARTKFWASPALKARKRLGRNSSSHSHNGLLEAEGFAPLGGGFTKFWKGLQLIFISSKLVIRLFIDIYVKNTQLLFEVCPSIPAFLSRIISKFTS